MTIFEALTSVRICSVALLSLAVFPVHLASAESGQRRYPVTTAMIVSAMQQRQMPVAGVHIRISAPITALSSNPMLDIQSISLTGTKSAQIRVACRTRNDCLPFYVAAEWTEANDPVSIPVTLSSPSTQPFAATLKAPSGGGGEQLIRSGTTATLVIEDEKVQIRLRVVYLQAGSPGDKVRVTTPDHKQAFVAQVVTPTLLKGSF
jgi:hypothetical protein